MHDSSAKYAQLSHDLVNDLIIELRKVRFAVRDTYRAVPFKMDMAALLSEGFILLIEPIPEQNVWWVPCTLSHCEACHWRIRKPRMSHSARSYISLQLRSTLSATSEWNGLRISKGASVYPGIFGRIFHDSMKDQDTWLAG